MALPFSDTPELIEPLPLARPDLGPEEEQAVLDVLRSGQLSLGPKLPEFERAFADWLGTSHASAVSSGTAGLHLALRAAGVRAGDEVITSPFSFIASSNSILYEGAKPVFVDIDPDTLNIDSEAARAAKTDRTAAYLPVHIFGYPADVATLEKDNLPIVEDACEALGATDNEGKIVGTRGNLSVFAFYANKQMTTGEGGMVIAPTPELKAIIDSERNQGRAPNMAWLDHTRLGYNYRLSEIACAIGTVQVAKLPRMLADRERVANLYTKTLEPLIDRFGIKLPIANRGNEKRSWFVYVIQLPKEFDRDVVIRDLTAKGIPAKPYLPSIHLYSFYKERFGYREGQFPVSEAVSRSSLALPFFTGMTEGQIERVVDGLAKNLDL